MLIVPADYRLDARHLPVGTLLLFLVCTFVFFLYQSGDTARMSAALDTYAGEELLRYEQPLLESYLAAEGAAVDGEDMDVYLGAVSDTGFDAYVRAYWETTEPAPEWVAARERFEAVRNQVSWLRFGLVPANVKPASLLGHLFLHGDVMHWLGNMIFLALFGLLLERVLGTALFIGTYLVGGLLAAGLFIATHSTSTIPLVGASGAISGLMGAYIGVYGLRKVRFFYTLGFWFGHFTAPALVVLPLWLAKELYGHFSGDGPIAYMAHAGGLLGGFALALLLKKQAAATLDVDENTQRDETVKRERLTRIRRLMAELHLEEALRLTEQSFRQSPAVTEYWQVYAEIAARLNVGAPYHRVMTTLFANAGQKAMPLAFLRETQSAYQQRVPGGSRALRGVGGAALARRYFREGATRDLDALLDGVFRQGGMAKEFSELLETLVAVAERNGDQRRATRYRQYLGAIAMQPVQTVAGPS